MIVTPSMLPADCSKEKALVTTANIQRAVTVHQSKELEPIACSSRNQGDAEKRTAVVEPFKHSANWSEQKPETSTPRPLGRQQRVIEPSLTPASSPVSQSISASPPLEPVNRNMFKDPMHQRFEFSNIGSPESPLSKMNVMPQGHDISDNFSELISPLR